MPASAATTWRSGWTANTEGFTQMGGEGAQLDRRGAVLQARARLPEPRRRHLQPFRLLAIRFAVASGVNITYKILYNDAVAMTGGQPHEGGLTVDMIAARSRRGRRAHRRRHRRAGQIPDRHRMAAGSHLPSPRRPRRRAARTARGEGRLGADLRPDLRGREAPPPQARHLPDPDKRVIINELVCEGCGDCGVQVELRLGRAGGDRVRPQAAIDQSSCNKDFSCLKGFCPSFVTVHGAQPRRPKAPARQGRPLQACLPEPAPARSTRGWASIVVVTGVGGTGVVTIGAILGMAAHLEGKGCGMIDMAGLAQKGGAVYSHVRIARTPEDIHAIRVGRGGGRPRARLRPRRVRQPRRCSPAVREAPRFVVNTAEVLPGDFTRNADFSLPTERLKRAIAGAAGGTTSSAFRRRHAHSPRRCSAIRSPPTCSCSAMPTSRAACRCRRPRSSGDRAQRRGGGDEPRRLPLGPPRRA
jgi:indolepyruvate ferredoxin oxidoreductase